MLDDIPVCMANKKQYDSGLWLSIEATGAGFFEIIDSCFWVYFSSQFWPVNLAK